tara:strand:- start:569 stop:1216 length:648 start_codon:yes stop_codon:yes gene_type:complete
MDKKNNLPETLPVFPLSNFIIFPNTSVPLNIFEPRYLSMVNDCLKKDRIFGMIQPKIVKKKSKKPELYTIGCAGKIVNFEKTEDDRMVLLLSGISRFKILEEISTEKLYRECKVNFEDFKLDRISKNDKIKFSDINLVFKDIKKFFKKKNLILDWKELEKQNIDQVLNTLCMIAPFTLEEKQVLLETVSLEDRKIKLKEVINTYALSNVENKTLQ